MDWNKWVRQIHRWLSIIFAAVVAAIFISLGAGKEPAYWVYLLPLFPLGLLLLTGLYMFVLPYAPTGATQGAPAHWSERMANKTSIRSLAVAKKPAANPAAAKPVLLAGGNPQIAKADGDAPVQAYIAAMPGWKRDVGRRLDALIVRSVPNVRKAVKWNSPFYGVEGQGWFLNFHCFTKYIKLAFFRGASLHPVPPGESKHKDVRYLDIRQDDQLDETQLAAWVKQASQLPGERM